eukprot:2586044-Rhodomonas_salina.2
MAHPSVVDNFRVIPGAEYTHAGYLNSGELVVRSARCSPMSAATLPADDEACPCGASCYLARS